LSNSSTSGGGKDNNNNNDDSHHNHHFHDLTYDEIVKIRQEIEAQFYPKIERGIQNKGLLEAISKRPSFKHYDQEHFPDLYSKCASLMEAIIQWHPFVDGNKRMGLAVAYYYMYKNECILLMPLSAVRFTVLIAKGQRNLQGIREWVKTHTAHNLEEEKAKSHRYVILPIVEMLLLRSQGIRDNDQIALQRAKKMIDNWLAVDIYPEYKMEQMQIATFLSEFTKKLPESPLFHKDVMKRL
jgi:death-on-curing family protein